ncbi:type II toxin-antitoxin system RelE/ParE family toxin [Taibaiella koreensis]|uniref:type II toxin-antitoxin system RelE/ParE family toxin n=1 Tax=Taibaiella koreensis TaxID=1268548 RepID=UPI000E59C804|nr:type II toxin-antitoxin system RelE/ParE family toxin [Taibaiella koreensis]
MPKYVLTRKAVNDLSRIWNYTFETWSEKQADRYYQMLIEACEHVAKDPQTGKEYREIGPHIMGHRIGKHIVFYRIAKPNVISLRILHEKMDLKSSI